MRCYTNRGRAGPLRRSTALLRRRRADFYEHRGPRDPPPRRLKQNGAAPAPHGAAALQDERPAHRHVQAHQQGLERRPRDVKRARWGRAGREGRESAPWRRYDGGGATYEHEARRERRRPSKPHPQKTLQRQPHRSTTRKKQKGRSSSARRKPPSPSGTTSTTTTSSRWRTPSASTIPSKSE